MLKDDHAFLGSSLFRWFHLLKVKGLLENEEIIDFACAAPGGEFTIRSRLMNYKSTLSRNKASVRRVSFIRGRIQVEAATLWLSPKIAEFLAQP